jgi:UDP-glucose 4-epimerase
MAKVLITGGAGFIGGFVAQALLRAGHTVHLVDNLARGRHDRFLSEVLAASQAVLFERDLLRSGALDDLPGDYTHVFHLAALLGVQNVIDRPYPTLRDNVTLLQTVLDWAGHQTRLERLVFASTSEVYAGSLELGMLPIPTPEDAPIALPQLGHPRTSYMLSKIYGEAMVRHCGLPFTIVRPHNVYGPRMGRAHVIPQLLERADRCADGAELEVFSIDHSRTFCFIDDAVEMLIRVAFGDSCRNEVLNLGRQSPEISIGELAHHVLRVTGRRLKIVPRPATPGSPRRRCPDMSRLRERTGFAAQVDLQEGLSRTYAWYRSAVFEGGETEVAE